MVEAVSYGKRPLEATQIVATANLTNGSTPQNSDTSPSEYSYLVSGSRDRSVRLWDPAQGQCLKVFTVHDSWVRGVLLHPSGKYIISCSDDKSIRVIDIKDGRCMRTLNDAHGHFITCLALSPQHSALLTGSVDKTIAVWPCS